jgi:hypothetical protein
MIVKCKYTFLEAKGKLTNYRFLDAGTAGQSGRRIFQNRFYHHQNVNLCVINLCVMNYEYQVWAPRRPRSRAGLATPRRGSRLEKHGRANGDYLCRGRGQPEGPFRIWPGSAAADSALSPADDSWLNFVPPWHCPPGSG